MTAGGAPGNGEIDSRAALERALEERNALWEELHRRAARERELEAARAEVARMQGSLSWRVTRPLRVVNRLKDIGIREYRKARRKLREGGLPS